MTTKQTHASVKPVVVTVRIPAELHQRLSDAAHERGMSQSLLIAQAIEHDLDAEAASEAEHLMDDYRAKTRAHQEFIRLTGGSTIG